MSQLTDFLSSSLDAALGVIGTTTFRLLGFDFTGDLDKSSADRELMDDGGGFVGEYAGTIVAAVAQFRGKISEPIERTVVGEILTINNLRFRILSASVDSISLTLTVINPSGKK